MYQYAFFSRVLAFLALIVVGLVCMPTAIQNSRLKARVTESQRYLQTASRDQMVMNNLVPELIRYSMRDPSILPLLQKYGINPPPASMLQPPSTSKSKKK